MIVTQSDREAACEHYCYHHATSGTMVTRMAEGECDGHRLVQAFARHRLSALEAAAAIADQYVGSSYRHPTRNAGFAAGRIAREIRAMRDSDGSPKGGDDCGSVHDSAAIAQMAPQS